MRDLAAAGVRREDVVSELKRLQQPAPSEAREDLVLELLVYAVG
jgi:hypothetical protein